MGIELFWDDEAETVLLLEVRGKWQWSELIAVMKTIQRMSREREQVFGALVDITQGLQLPDGGIFSQQGLAQFQQLLTLEGASPNAPRGPLVIVGMNALVQRILDTVTTISRDSARNIFFVDTMPAAQEQVYAHMARLTQPRPRSV